MDFMGDFLSAAEEAGTVKGKRVNYRGLLWGAHQRFFLQMCLAIKYDHTSVSIYVVILNTNLLTIFY